MCGVAGILARHGSPDEGALRRMAAALAHRGPDDLGIHRAGPFAVLQTRLSIIDLERGHQPMVDDAFALAANGEIYNFVELRRELEARGRRFTTASDSETICTPTRSTASRRSHRFTVCSPSRSTIDAAQELVLARDRLGIKPLYYARLPDRLLFASELKALLAVWPGERELDPARAGAVPPEPIQHRRHQRDLRHPPSAAGHGASRRRRSPRVASTATGRRSTCARATSTSKRRPRNSTRCSGR